MPGFKLQRRSNAQREERNVRDEIGAENDMTGRARAVAHQLVVIVGIRLAVRPDQPG